MVRTHTKTALLMMMNRLPATLPQTNASEEEKAETCTRFSHTNTHTHTHIHSSKRGKVACVCSLRIHLFDRSSQRARTRSGFPNPRLLPPVSRRVRVWCDAQLGRACRVPPGVCAVQSTNSLSLTLTASGSAGGHG